MKIKSTVAASLQAGLSTPLFTTVKDIGAWNMDTTAQKSFVHGLTITTVKGWSVKIWRDNQTDLHDLISPDNLIILNGSMWFSSTHIFLNRLTGGFFDGPAFDNVAINRGHVIIWHT